jgi:hypothetical protein
MPHKKEKRTTMTTTSEIFISLCLLALLVQACAWGPRFDAIQGGHRLLGNTILQSKRQDHDSDETVLIEAYRFKLQSAFISHFNGSDDIHNSLRKQQNYVNSEDNLFDDALFINLDGSEWFEQCGTNGDCDVCEIPDELKMVPGAVDPVDVMEFLGIRRVQPLRKTRDWE